MSTIEEENKHVEGSSPSVRVERTERLVWFKAAPLRCCRTLPTLLHLTQQSELTNLWFNSKCAEISGTYFWFGILDVG